MNCFNGCDKERCNLEVGVGYGKGKEYAELGDEPLKKYLIELWGTGVVRTFSEKSEVAFACSEGNRWIVIIKDNGEAVSVADWESSFQKQVSER